MALGDESFYNILGDEINRTILVQIMIDFFDELIADESTEITDFNEGSEIRNILESLAVDIYHLEENDNEQSKIAFISTAYGEWLDKHGEKYNIYRDEGSEAVGILEFSVPSPLPTEVIIPEETIVVCEDSGLQYITSVETVLSVGETSVSCQAYCYTSGADGNADADTITIFFENPPDNSMSVTNPEPFTGGRDWEDDDSFRERIELTAKQDSFGSLSYYMNLGANVDGVHDVYLAEDPSELYTKLVVVNGDEKPTPDNVMVQCLAQFTRQENLVLKHKFGVVKPTYVDLDLKLYLYVYDIIDQDEVSNLLKCLLNGGSYDGTRYEGLSVGESLSKNRIMSVLETMSEIANVEAIEMKGSDGKYHNLSDYAYANGREVLRLGNVDIIYTEVSR